MLYIWTKVMVGVLLAANFAVPLYTVVSNRQLHDEPMAVLAGNLSFTGLVFGLLLTMLGVYDLAQLQWRWLCLLLQCGSFGVGVAMKLAQVSMAVDQFVAVIHPLHHYQLMGRALRWLLLATGLGWAVETGFGLVTGWMGLETVAERLHGRDNGTAVFPECRWESSGTNVVIVSGEVALVFLSFGTAGLFVYTGVVGSRTKARLTRMMQQQRRDAAVSRDHQDFFDNFKAFKTICLVLSLTMVMDIVGPVVRLSGRWYPMPKVSSFLHQVRMLGFLFEGWAYGLLNAKMRAAYKKTFCGRSGTVAAESTQRQQERGVAVQRQQEREIAVQRWQERELTVQRQEERELTVQHQEREMTVPRQQEREMTDQRQQEQEMTAQCQQEREMTTQRQQEREMTVPRQQEWEMTDQRQQEQEMTAQCQQERDMTTQRQQEREMTDQRQQEQEMTAQRQQERELRAQRQEEREMTVPRQQEWEMADQRQQERESKRLSKRLGWEMPVKRQQKRKMIAQRQQEREIAAQRQQETGMTAQHQQEQGMVPPVISIIPPDLPSN